MGRLKPSRKSLEHTCTNGQTLGFATRADYVQALVDAKEISDLTDLVENFPHKVAGIQVAWMCQPQVGCVFAQRLAQSYEAAGFVNVVVQREIGDPGFASHVNALLDASVEASEAMQLIFPRICTEPQIRQLLGVLEHSGRWSVVTIDSNNDEEAYDLFGVRWTLPDEISVSWVLGLADLESMPITRRAPFTSLVVRSGPPGRAPKLMGKARPPKDSRGLMPVHLADMEPLGWVDKKIRRVWNHTTKLKARLIPEEQGSRARAKVTFSLPKELR